MKRLLIAFLALTATMYGCEESKIIESKIHFEIKSAQDRKEVHEIAQLAISLDLDSMKLVKSIEQLDEWHARNAVLRAKLWRRGIEAPLGKSFTFLHVVDGKALEALSRPVFSQEDLDRFQQTGKCEYCCLSNIDLRFVIHSLRERGIKIVLDDAIIVHSDLSNADLSSASLRGVNFSGTDLSGANLSGADLFCTKLPKAYSSSTQHGKKF